MRRHPRPFPLPILASFGLLHVVLNSKVGATFDVEIVEEVDDDDEALPIDSFNVYLVGVTSEHRIDKRVGTAGPRQTCKPWSCQKKSTACSR
jgi:hypothetical protein